MAIILCIETSTRNCSVCLFDSNKIISFKENLSQKYSHSEMLTVLIKSMLEEKKFLQMILMLLRLVKGLVLILD